MRSMQSIHLCTHLQEASKEGVERVVVRGHARAPMVVVRPAAVVLPLLPVGRQREGHRPQRHPRQLPLLDLVDVHVPRHLQHLIRLDLLHRPVRLADLPKHPRRQLAIAPQATACAAEGADGHREELVQLFPLPHRLEDASENVQQRMRLPQPALQSKAAAPIQPSLAAPAVRQRGAGEFPRCERERSAISHKREEEAGRAIGRSGGLGCPFVCCAFVCGDSPIQPNRARSRMPWTSRSRSRAAAISSLDQPGAAAGRSMAWRPAMAGIAPGPAGRPHSRSPGWFAYLQEIGTLDDQALSAGRRGRKRRVRANLHAADNAPGGCRARRAAAWHEKSHE